MIQLVSRTSNLKNFRISGKKKHLNNYNHYYIVRRFLYSTTIKVTELPILNETISILIIKKFLHAFCIKKFLILFIIFYVVYKTQHFTTHR